MDLTALVELIKQDKKSREITPRLLFNSLGYERRTTWNCHLVDKFLADNNLEIEPHYNDVWIDHTILLKHKTVAKRKSQTDPIKKLVVLEAATKLPITIKRDSKLNAATTLMLLHKYSQLPVISNTLKDLCGYISWETIGSAITNGIKSDSVKDYINPFVKTLSVDTPILKAINTVHKYEFVIVLNREQEICGIVTTTDISSQFLAITEPFVLLEQIENHIRLLLDNRLLLEDIHKVWDQKFEERELKGIDDLTFGQYIRLMENPENWAKLEINCDQTLFIKELHKVRNVRNDIMHFEPAGITSEQYNLLRHVSEFLSKLISYRIKEK